MAVKSVCRSTTCVHLYRKVTGGLPRVNSVILILQALRLRVWKATDKELLGQICPENIGKLPSCYPVIHFNSIQPFQLIFQQTAALTLAGNLDGSQVLEWKPEWLYCPTDETSNKREYHEYKRWKSKPELQNAKVSFALTVGFQFCNRPFSRTDFCRRSLFETFFLAVGKNNTTDLKWERPLPAFQIISLDKSE